MPREVRDVVFVDGVRTPFGKAGGMYADTRADDLVIRCIRELLRRNPQLPPERVDEVAIAATTQIGDQGLTIGRTAALLAGLPKTVPGYAIDRMCAGAMTAVTTRRRRHRDGRLRRRDRRRRRAHGPPPDGRGRRPQPADPGREAGRPVRAGDGLRPRRTCTTGCPHITKERADAFGLASQEKTAKAYANGKLQADLVPVAIRDAETRLGPGHRRRGARASTSHGEAGHAQDAVPPARQGDRGQRGRPQRRRHRRACSPARTSPASWACRSRMRLVSYGFVGVEPEVMGFGPIPSTEKALRMAGLTIDDIGLFELNEAFAVQVLAFLDHFGIADDDPRVNPWGGAIAVGHPLASSGVRLMTQLARQFAEHPEVRYGLTAMCIGIGMGGTVIWENPALGGPSK